MTSKKIKFKRLTSRRVTRKRVNRKRVNRKRVKKYINSKCSKKLNGGMVSNESNNKAYFEARKSVQVPWDVGAEDGKYLQPFNVRKGDILEVELNKSKEEYYEIVDVRGDNGIVNKYVRLLNLNTINEDSIDNIIHGGTVKYVMGYYPLTNLYNDVPTEKGDDVTQHLTLYKSHMTLRETWQNTINSQFGTKCPMGHLIRHFFKQADTINGFVCDVCRIKFDNKDIYRCDKVKCRRWGDKDEDITGNFEVCDNCWHTDSTDKTFGVKSTDNKDTKYYTDLGITYSNAYQITESLPKDVDGGYIIWKKDNLMISH